MKNCKLKKCKSKLNNMIEKLKKVLKIVKLWNSNCSVVNKMLNNYRISILHFKRNTKVYKNNCEITHIYINL